MRKFPIYISCCLVLVFGSCKTIRKLTDKDGSMANSAPKKTRKSNPVFLDNIEVTPGNAVTSRHKTSTTNQRRKITEAGDAANNDASYGYSNPNIPKLDIEKVAALQYKYSLIVNAPVEELNNLPLLQLIDQWWATPYCLGGNTQNCIDCSGFTKMILKDVYGKELKRTAKEQQQQAEKIGVNELREGDLVFFQTTGRSISHVGVYLTNNKFAHASSSGGVTISDLNDRYWQPRFRGAGRVYK